MKINLSLKPLEVPLESLHLDPKNMRLHDEKNINAIAASLEAFGQQKPIVTLRNGKVIAGNGTLLAATKLGWDRIAVVQFDSESEAMATAFAIADNRTAELAEWDDGVYDLMKNMREDFDFTSIGFDLEDIMGTSEPQGSDVEQLSVFGVEPIKKVSKGQIYRLGQHVLAVCEVGDDHLIWSKYLTPETYFAPYPSPLAFTKELKPGMRMLLVQPDEFIAGHIVDKFTELVGEAEVELL